MKIIVRKITADGYMLEVVPQAKHTKRRNWLGRLRDAIRRVIK